MQFVLLFQSLVAICQSIIVGDQNASLVAESSGNVSVSAAALAQSPPPGFCSVAVRLVTMQMVALGVRPLACYTFVIRGLIAPLM